VVGIKPGMMLAGRATGIGTGFLKLNTVQFKGIVVQAP